MNKFNNDILTNELICLVLVCLAFRLKDTTHVDDYFNFCRANTTQNKQEGDIIMRMQFWIRGHVRAGASLVAKYTTTL